jgi:hypothetical protein
MKLEKLQELTQELVHEDRQMIANRKDHREGVVFQARNGHYYVRVKRKDGSLGVRPF